MSRECKDLEEELLLTALSFCVVLDTEQLSRRIQNTYGKFGTFEKTQEASEYVDLDAHRSMVRNMAQLAVVQYGFLKGYPRMQKVFGWTYATNPHVCEHRGARDDEIDRRH